MSVEVVGYVVNPAEWKWTPNRFYCEWPVREPDGGMGTCHEAAHNQKLTHRAALGNFLCDAHFAEGQGGLVADDFNI